MNPGYLIGAVVGLLMLGWQRKGNASEVEVTEPVALAPSDATNSPKLSTSPFGIGNNNPGNIRYSPANNWLGQVGERAGFVVFSAPEYGIRAMGKLITTYRTKYGLNTISGIISKWAPPVENPTSDYVSFVERQTGIGRSVPINADSIPSVVAAIIHFENGMQPFDESFINRSLML